MKKAQKIQLANKWIEKLQNSIIDLNNQIALAEEWSERRSLVEERMRAENNLEDWKIELDKVTNN